MFHLSSRIDFESLEANSKTRVEITKVERYGRISFVSSLCFRISSQDALHCFYSIIEISRKDFAYILHQKET